MKYLSSILVLGIMALAMSCNSSLIGDQDLDSVDWGSIEENVFLAKNNQKETLTDDCSFKICRYYLNTEKPGVFEKSNTYLCHFILSSEDYYVKISAQEPISFPINGRGVMSFDNYVINYGSYQVCSKENGPTFEGGGQHDYFYSSPCKILINGEVKQEGGYSELEAGTYGDAMKGNIQLKIILKEKNINYKFSFDMLIPLYLDEEPIVYCIDHP